MRLIIDTAENKLVHEDGGKRSVFGLYTPEAFLCISEQWIKVGWDLKYSYAFSWLGRPVIQLPEDMIRMQEVIYRIRPDVVVETGVAHGGSLIYYASLCKLMGKGRVIGVDVEIRPHNRKAIEAHFLSSLVTLVEGDSIAPQTVQRVLSLVKPGETALVVLDSCHSKQHVLAELESYHGLVSAESYIVATDGIRKMFHDVPNGVPEWKWDHPEAAAVEFAAKHPEFVVESPPWPFNESRVTSGVTYWPGAWLRRKSGGAAPAEPVPGRGSRPQA